MDIRKLQRAIVDGLEDVKAQDILVFNTEQLSPLFERVVIASGSSNRQTKALAASVRDAVKSRGMAVMRTEGEDNGEWIIVDCGAAVVHIMQPAIRQYYHLEEIWGGKPVKLKLTESTRALPKASEPMEPDEDDADDAAAAARPAVKKAGAGKPAARKPAAKTAAAKTATAKTSAAKKHAATKPAAKKPAAKKPAAKKPAAKSPTSKKAAPQSAAVKAAAPAARKGGAPRAAGKTAMKPGSRVGSRPSTPRAAAGKAPAAKKAAPRRAR